VTWRLAFKFQTNVRINSHTDLWLIDLAFIPQPQSKWKQTKPTFSVSVFSLSLCSIYSFHMSPNEPNQKCKHTWVHLDCIKHKKAEIPHHRVMSSASDSSVCLFLASVQHKQQHPEDWIWLLRQLVNHSWDQAPLRMSHRHHHFKEGPHCHDFRHPRLALRDAGL